MTPPTSVSSRIGSSPMSESRPRKNADAEPVSVTMSHACATFCIHVPMLEPSAPIHRRRKSLWVRAEARRRMAAKKCACKTADLSSECA